MTLDINSNHYYKQLKQNTMKQTLILAESRANYVINALGNRVKVIDKNGSFYELEIDIRYSLDLLDLFQCGVDYGFDLLKKSNKPA